MQALQDIDTVLLADNSSWQLRMNQQYCHLLILFVYHRTWCITIRYSITKPRYNFFKPLKLISFCILSVSVHHLLEGAKDLPWISAAFPGDTPAASWLSDGLLNLWCLNNARTWINTCNGLHWLCAWMHDCFRLGVTSVIRGTWRGSSLLWNRLKSLTITSFLCIGLHSMGVTVLTWLWML